MLSGTGAEAGRAGQGQVVAGRYQLRERVGSGGMGTVWLAEDPLLGRRVALKTMHAPERSDQARATAFERTRREARSVARISHPNVVVVHDVVAHEGLPCIVMEYVPSRTLADVLKQDGTVTEDEAVRIGHGMIQALRAAHAAGVLHRDVKPGNVLLGTDGRVVLTDFGIAMATDTSSLTRTGEVIGSVDYLAPERLHGESPAAPSDLWALGATLYAAVEGRPPFQRDTPMGTAYAITTDPPHPMIRDTPLSPLIRRLLEKDPAARPSGEETEAWLRARAAPPEAASAAPPAGGPPGGHTAGLPPGPPAGGPDRRRRTGRRRTIWAAVAVLVAAAVAATALTALNRGEDESGRKAPPSPGDSPSPKSSRGSGEKRQEKSASPSPSSSLPAGYHFEEEKEHGLAIPLPDDWLLTDTADSDFAYTGPAKLAALRVSVGDLAASDQLQRWKDDRDQSASEGKLPGYSELRMQRTTYRGMPAAVWEFTFRGRERQFRGIYLGFGEPGGKEYALYLSAPSDDWERHRKVFDLVRENLRIETAAE